MATAFEPVSRRTVAQEVRDRLVAAIRTGELVPGSQLPAERILCQEFGVARTSVREAIQGLVSTGFIERRGNRPVIAEKLPPLDLTLDDRKASVRQLFEVRRVIEPAMAALAAERAEEAQRVELRELAARSPDDLDEFRSIDRAFHSLIGQACANPLLSEVYAKTLAALFGSGQFASLLYAEINREEVREIIASATEAHRSIATAIATGDRGRTAEAVKDHLDDVERRMVERLL